jgi:NAD(P)-dependent dehydrogenase (short-subunit alcohol dehydrogenase family)
MRSLVRGICFAGGAGVAAALTTRALLRKARSFSYNGKSVLITGASRGLGLVLARQLVDAGARVAICARHAQELEVAAQELREQGGDVLSMPCDVRDPAQVRAMIDDVLAQWGTLDVLINNAGVIEVGPLEAMTLEDFQRAMDTHYWGALYTVLAVLPAMRQRGWGRIVNIASFGGKQAVPHMLPYTASKFALVGLSHGLRTELARDGILVTTVCPGLMRTGSPRNATFKGQHRHEYAWFSISDALPLLSMDATKAAQQILLACQRGDAEAIISGPAKMALTCQAIAPGLMTELLSVANRLLPAMGGIGTRSARGYDSESSLSPSLLTRLGDQAAAHNNEIPLAGRLPS